MKCNFLYPNGYEEHFASLNDFTYFHGNTEYKGQGDIRIFQADFFYPENFCWNIQNKKVTHVILPNSPDTITNIMLATRALEAISTLLTPVKTLMFLYGGKKVFNMFKDKIDIFILPISERTRMAFITQAFPRMLYEMTSITEVKNLNPDFLITGLPIRAAVLGIDITLRSRRPKNIDYLEPKYMSESSISLARETILKIKGE